LGILCCKAPSSDHDRALCADSALEKLPHVAVFFFKATSARVPLCVTADAKGEIGGLLDNNVKRLEKLADEMVIARKGNSGIPQFATKCDRRVG